MNNSEKDITKIISREIVTKSLDLSIDYSEIAIDELVKGELLKEIPLVKSIAAFYNIGTSVIHRHNTKKILTFFQEFNARKINELKYNQFLHKFNTDTNYQNDVIETILLLNERFLQVEKSKILANLIISHIESKISWEEFVDLSTILDCIHPKGLLFLGKMSLESWRTTTINGYADESLMYACGIGKRNGSKFQIVEMGRKFYEFGLKPLGY